MELKRIVEAVLFASDAPLRADQIATAVPAIPAEEIDDLLGSLRDQYEREGRGWRLVEVAGGWQLLSHPDLYPYVERFLEGKRRARLSRAALESLAVIAYRQPITRGELEELRGVDCGAVLHTLIERDLITISGRSAAIGRPLLYGTTERFLEHFGLVALRDLPRLEEIDSLLSSDEIRLQVEEEFARRFAGAVPAPDGGDGGDGDPAAAQDEVHALRTDGE